MTELLLTLISAALINNLVLHWPLGVDPVLGSERPQVHALGIATTCLMLITGTLGYALYYWLLVPLGLTSLRLFVFLPLSVLLIGPLLKLLSRLLAKLSFDGLWPLLLGNAGGLGLTLLNAQDDKGIFPRHSPEPWRRAGFLASTEFVQRLAPAHTRQRYPPCPFAACQSS